jgi:hypothetical protein
MKMVLFINDLIFYGWRRRFSADRSQAERKRLCNIFR